MDRVVAGLSAQGLAASTRRGYVQAFKGFHAFLVARKAAEIEAVFGVRLVNPVDEFNAARHVGADSPSVNPPPGPERMEEFFGFLKERIAGARKYTAGAGIMRCSGRCIWPGSGRRSPLRWTGPRCTSAGGRSASCMSGSARVPGHRARGRGGCRCWMAWT